MLLSAPTTSGDSRVKGLGIEDLQISSTGIESGEMKYMLDDTYYEAVLELRQSYETATII